ncbi:unnamed protein product [Ectocarpus sp. 12 AP-2014]
MGASPTVACDPGMTWISNFFISFCFSPIQSMISEDAPRTHRSFRVIHNHTQSCLNTTESETGKAQQGVCECTRQDTDLRDLRGGYADVKNMDMIRHTWCSRLCLFMLVSVTR